MKPDSNHTNSSTGQIYRDLQQWHAAKTKTKNRETGVANRVQIIPIAMNTFQALSNDELDDYGDYDTPWKLDSGASGHFAGRRTGVRKRRKIRNGIRVGVANGQSMDQLEGGELPFDAPEGATDVQIFDNMPRPLIGAGKLVKAGAKIILDQPLAHVIDKATNEVIMTAHFDEASLTWDVYPKQQVGQTANTTTMPPAAGMTMTFAGNAYRINTKKELVSFYHAAAGWPVKSTWIAAIKRNAFASWPGLTEALVIKYLDIKEPTVMGHMHARRSGQRTTKLKLPNDKKEKMDLLQQENEELEPPRNKVLLERTRRVGAHIIAHDELKGSIATDLAGVFPVMSNRGMKYIFILYDYDTNVILASPMRSRKGEEIVRAYEECYKKLKDAGVTPVLQYLDNEVSQLLIDSIKNKQLSYQLASPNDHRLNPAERAVQTFKNHFVAILNGTDTRYPKYLWCRLIHQAVITLNMLRKSRINPKLSAYAQVFGEFNYNRTPLAPLGTKVIIHERANQRGTWADHGKAGWYTGPADQHYRHYEVYITTTGGSRVSDTIEFFPTKVTMPKTSSDDRITAAIEELTEAVKNPAPRAPFMSGNKTAEAIKSLTEIFHSTEDNSAPSAAARPRVPTHSASKRIAPIPGTAPRVATDLETDSPQHEMGTVIYKKFNNTVHKGTVTAYDTNQGYYKISYEDGDEEELTYTEVQGYCTKRNQPTSEARHQQVEREYWSTVNSGRRRSGRIEKLQPTFTAGYAKAADHLQETWYHRVDWIPQEYKIYANSVIDEATGKKMEYRDLIKHPSYKEDWLESGANEFGRLFQGIGKKADGTQRVKGTNTCVWIDKAQVPRNKKVTYARIVVDVRPEKAEPNRTRITAGGDRLEYFGDVSTETSSLETAKLLFNSIVSTPGAKFMTLDISNMYLNTPLKDFQYMRFNIDVIPAEVIDEYDLKSKVDENGWVYVEIRMAIYGLKESGKLANVELQKVLAAAGYTPSRFTPGLYRHETRPIAFSLVVDDFGVKYTRKEDAEHLEKILRNHYPMKSDWTGEYYLGMTLKWDYVERTVKLSMPGYVREALLQFQHTKTKNVYAPSPYTKPIYGKKQQMAPVDDTPPLDKKQQLLLQQICGKFLYYARAVDNTMMHALNDLATRITTGTQKTNDALKTFLDYCATYPDAVIMYRASDMILLCDSDAAYLVAPKARSRAGGYIYLGNRTGKPQIINAPISVLAKILKMVVASAAEAEIAALFVNAQDLVPLRVTLEELGHPQPPTAIRTDNSTANGIVNGTIKQKKSKAIDMRFYWVRDRVEAGQFVVYWEPGENNLSDYYTKHQPAKRVRRIRPIYIHTSESPSSLQGCVDLLTKES